MCYTAVSMHSTWLDAKQWLCETCDLSAVSLKSAIFSAVLFVVLPVNSTSIFFCCRISASWVYYVCVNTINCTGKNMSDGLLYALGVADANLYLCSKELRPGERISSFCFLPSVPSVLRHCWLGVRKSIRPVRNWLMRCRRGCRSVARCRFFADGPADALHPKTQSLVSFKFRLVLPFQYRLSQIVLEKMPLNGSTTSSSCSRGSRCSGGNGGSNGSSCSSSWLIDYW